MKKYISDCCSWRKLLNLFQVSILMLLAGNIQNIHAENFSNIPENKITIQLNEVSLKTVFQNIEQQTSYTFFYENDIVDLNKKVSINGTDLSIENVLVTVLKDSGLDFKIISDQIVLTRKLVLQANEKKLQSRKVVVTTITGKVTDDTGAPLPGVNVIVEGTEKGIQTNFDGEYSIDADKGQVLTFSYLGFVSVSKTITDATVINVSMEQDVAALGEVVVVGYGTTKKSDLTGAVGIIGSKELAKFPVADAASVIQGRVAGVRVESNGGAPGANQLVTIRGSSTLSDNGPLYVIDGLIGGNINLINPADIESISVLKDASSTAIYGSRAANGVIIVTTKKGKRGKIVIDIENSYGFQQTVKYIDYANAREYADIVNRSRTNDGNATFLANDAEFNPNIDSDIQRKSLRNAPISNTNVRISGGSDNLTYSLSGNVFKQDGIVKESSYERKTLRSNATFEKGKFKLQNTIGLSQTEDNFNPFFNKERDLIPTIPIRDAAGNFTGTAPGQGLSFNGVGNVINSLASATLEDRTNTNTGMQGNLVASYEFIEGLSYKLNLGLNYGLQNNYRFNPKFKLNASDGGRNEFAELDERNTTSVTSLIEHTLNYKKEIKKHTFDVLAGYTEQKFNERRLGAIVRKFPKNDLRVASAGSEIAEIPSFDNTSVIQSFLGRLNYNFDDRYLFTASIRRDGSSLFAEDLRWGVFPSVAIGWNIGNESFMENVDFLQDLKVRASYGEIGSNNVDPYRLRAIINQNSQYLTGNDQSRADGFSITQAVNADIKWETTKTTDIGLEFKTLDRKLDIVMDYFIKESEDILVGVEGALSLGKTGTFPANAASITNKGFEFYAGYTDNVGELNFNISGNFTILDNEVTKVGPNGAIIAGSFTSNTINSTKTDVGEPVASFFGYVVEGIYQTDAEAAVATTNANPQAGDFRFKDLNNDGVIDTEDQQYLGSPIPNFEYGFNVNLDYKNFDLTLFFNGVSGNKILNGQRFRGFFDTEGNYLKEALNGWRLDNTSTNIPRNTLVDPGQNKRMSDFYLEDGSYFRLRNVQLGYSLPENIAGVIGASRLRVYASIQNLFTITGYTGYYPEVGRNSRGGEDAVKLFASGVDESAYPTAKTFQLGVQLSF